MKRVHNASDIFKNSNSSDGCDDILNSIKSVRDTRKKLDKVLSALKVEEVFPRKSSKKISNITHNLKIGDIIIKNGSKTMGEIVGVNNDSLDIRIGGKIIKVWRSEIRRIM